jgi:hypothetical protein
MLKDVIYSIDNIPSEPLVEINIDGPPVTVFGRLRHANEKACEWQVMHRGRSGTYLCASRVQSQQASIDDVEQTEGLVIKTVSDETVVAAARWASARAMGDGSLIETGIKAIDLLCPLIDGGTTAFLGGPGQGRVVLLQELYTRLSSRASHQALVFLIDESVATGVPEMIAADPEFPPDQAGGLITVWAITPRASDVNFVADDGPWTTRFLFSADEAGRGNYPALDLVRSKCFTETCWRDARHAEVAAAVREALANPDAPRAARLRAYLTQPFFVTAETMGCPGISVPLSQTIEDCAAILAGDLDQVELPTLYLIGGLDAY